MASRIKYKNILTSFFLFNIIVLFIYGCAGGGNDKEKAESFFKSGMTSLEAGKTNEAVILFKNAVQKYPFHSQARFQLANIYKNSGKPVMAGRELNIALINDPNFYEAKRALAFLYFENSAFLELIPLCEDLLKVKADDLDILNILGNSFLFTSQADQGKSTFEKAIKSFPGSKEAKIGLIQSLMAAQQTDEAGRLLESFVAQNPNDITIQILLANYYGEISKYNMALKTLNSLLEAKPEEPLSYLALASFFMRSNNPQDAENYLRKAINKGIHDIRIHQGLGIILHQQKNYKKALKQFEETASLWPDHKKNLIILADYYVFLKDYQKGISTYNFIIQKWPEMEAIKSKIAEMHLSEGKIKEAASVVDQIITEQSSNSRGHLLRGLLWQMEGDIQKARQSFSKVRELSPESPDGFLYYGMTFLKEKDYQIAESLIFKALENEPESLRARMALVYLYFQNNKFKLALIELNKILRTHPDNYSAKVMRAGLHLKTGDFDSAIADYLELANLKTASPTDYFRLADAYMYKGDLRLALDEFIKLKKIHPESIPLVERIVKIYLAQNKQEKALQACNSFLSKFPGSDSVSLLKSEILLSQNKFSEAVLILENIHKDSPQADRALILQARIKKLQKDEQAAAQLYVKATEINPGNIDALMSMANHYKNMGQNQKAIEAYQQLLTHHPDFVPAMNNQAYILTETGGDLAFALTLAQKAYELAPGNPDIMDTLGWVYFKMANNKMARKYFNEAHTASPGDHFFLYHLAMALFNEQSFEAAEEKFKMAINLGLQGKELKSAQESLDKISQSKLFIKEAAKYRDAGKFAEAAAIYEDHLQKNSFSAPVANELAYIYAQMESNLDRALELAKKAHEIIDEKGFTSDTLGWVYYKKGSYSLAKMHINNAINEDPEKGLYHYHLGMVLFKENDFTEASKVFTKALELGLETQDRKSTALKILESMK